jgi:hypothetical protein
MANAVGPNCLIQGDFGGNLESLLFADGHLHHLYRQGTTWSVAQTLPSPASGPGSMIQSDFGGGPHGNFEAVLWNANELVHWWHDNSDVKLPWQRGQTISTKATGPGSIIQSDFGGGRHKNFEVVVLEGTNLVHYWHDNSDVRLPWQRGQTITINATGPGCIIQSDFGGGDHKNFEVIVLEGNNLVHYWHDNSDVRLPWQRGQTITTHADGPGSIIQGSFGSGKHKNFEVVVLEGNNLVHWWHDNSDVDLRWQQGQTISVAATGPGCIAKSTLDPWGPKDFEIVVTELTRSVVHYWHHNNNVAQPWWRNGPMPNFAENLVNSADLHQTAKVAQLTGEIDRQTHAPTLSRTESRFGVVGCDLGQSFEHEGRAYFLFGDTNTDNRIRKDPSSALDSIGFTSDTDAGNGIKLDFNRSYPHVDGINQGGFCVPTDGLSVPPGLSGPGWLIQSDYGGQHKNFEAVVMQGSDLVHYWRDNSDTSLPWTRGQTITTNVTGPGCIIQSDFGGDHKNFEVVVLQTNELVHYWRDNSNSNLSWRRGQTISTNATGPGCIIQSNFGSKHGNFEVVVPEGNNLAHWWHDNSDVSLPWKRGQIITTQATGPGCIIQSNFGSKHGNFEVVVMEGNNLAHWWHDNSDVNLPWKRGQIISTSATGPGSIIQSDFGSKHGNFEVVVLEGNNLAHWWHDNSDVSLPWKRGQIISASATGPGSIIQSDFGSDHKNFEVMVPEVRQNGTSEATILVHRWHDNSDVNLPWQQGQTITQALMYVFFTTDPFLDGANASMGRSILARSGDGGLEFGTPLYELSKDKFINLSLQLIANKEIPGVPNADGMGILMWGSGGYRRSNVYLAYISLDQVEDKQAVRFFTGTTGRGIPHWSGKESDAVPLFLSGSVGELCVRWNPILRRFILLYNADNPAGILQHQSQFPWGPWTSGENIFDFSAAFGHFIHIANSGDGLSDPGREGEGGGTYGPYMISRYTRPNDDGSSKIFFVLSVWNPYNTMLMSATIRAREPEGISK